MCFSQPSYDSTPAPAPAPTPTASDADPQKTASDRQKKLEALRLGLASTIRTSPTGLGSSATIGSKSTLGA